MFILYSASTSMYCFTSFTVKKCRATSSIAPRHSNRGRSVIWPAGTVHCARRPKLICDSIPAGRSCRSVCVPRNSPAGDAARICTESALTRQLITFLAERRRPAESQRDRAGRRRRVALRDRVRERRRRPHDHRELLGDPLHLGVPRRHDDRRRGREREWRSRARDDGDGHRHDVMRRQRRERLQIGRDDGGRRRRGRRCRRRLRGGRSTGGRDARQRDHGVNGMAATKTSHHGVGALQAAVVGGVAKLPRCTARRKTPAPSFSPSSRRRRAASRTRAAEDRRAAGFRSARRRRERAPTRQSPGIRAARTTRSATREAGSP